MSSLSSELQGKIYHNGKDFTNYLKNSNEYNFLMNPIDKNEIINIINNLNLNKSTGPHSIPSDIVNIIKLNIASPYPK